MPNSYTGKGLFAEVMFIILKSQKKKKIDNALTGKENNAYLYALLALQLSVLFMVWKK